MAPFLPIRALNRSQQVRIGGTKVKTDTTTYVDLGDGKSRRELGNHTALGAVIVVGTISNTNADVVVVFGVNTDEGAANNDMVVRTYAGEIRNRATGTVIAVVLSDTTLATAHATLDRIDLVVVDSTSGAVTKVDGTAAASPVAPATPAGKTAIASVSVPANDTAITTNQVTDLRILGT